MTEKLLPAKHHWRLVTAVPPREVFAAVEQMVGTPPYRFEATGRDSARVVEYERNGIVGQWRQLARRDRDGGQQTAADGTLLWKVPVRWITVETSEVAAGTEVVVRCSRGLRGPFARLAGGSAPVHRSLQVVQLLSRGVHDRRSVYRDRRIPPGPVTLVASWAGMQYAVYLEPRYGAPRGEAVLTASRLVALGQEGTFVKVQTPTGAVGYVERDQLVPAPQQATREAQERTAAFG